MDSKEKIIALLSSTAAVNLAALATTDKLLYTVPVGNTMIVDSIVMHTFSEDPTTAVVTFGTVGGTSDEYLGDQTLTAVTASFATQSLKLQVVPHATVPLAQTTFATGVQFGVQITTAGAGTCTVEVWGHII